MRGRERRRGERAKCESSLGEKGGRVARFLDLSRSITKYSYVSQIGSQSFDLINIHP